MLAETAMITIATMGTFQIVLHRMYLSHVAKHLKQSAIQGKQHHSVFRMNAAFKVLPAIAGLDHPDSQRAVKRFFTELLGQVPFNPSGRSA